MAAVLEIKPSPERDGFFLYGVEARPIWFGQEHHAVGYAQEIYPGREIVVFHGEGIIKRRYGPVQRK